jgi:hypothetical protein
MGSPPFQGIFGMDNGLDIFRETIDSKIGPGRYYSLCREKDISHLEE